MVKIKIKTILVVVLFVLLAAYSVYAVTVNMVKIDNIKVTVDGKSDSGTINAKPGSDVKFKVKVLNLFTKTTGDLDIDSASVTITISSIDDGEDLEEESDDFDIRVDDDETVTLNFKIPMEVDEDEYNVKIRLDAEDENNTKYTVEDNSLTLKVNKETHDIRIIKADLTSNNLKCSRSTSLAVNLQNLGTSEENNGKLRIFSEQLGIAKDYSFNLGDDPFDADSKYSANVPITVSPDIESGVYPISVKVEYASSKTADKSVDLVVDECIKPTPRTTTTTIKAEPVDVIVIPAKTTSTTITPPIDDANDNEIVAEGSFISRNLPLILIAGINLLIITIAVILIAAWARKK